MSRTSLVPGKHATASPRPWNGPSRSDCSATASSSSGTPCTATNRTTQPNAAPAPPGSGPRPNPPPSTCSPSSGARSSPPDLCQHPPDQQQPKKSWKSSKPGHKPPHNRKSRTEYKATDKYGKKATHDTAGVLGRQHIKLFYRQYL